MDVIHVVGAGGIGCAVGHALARAGAPVTFVERRADKVAWGREHGVAVDRRPPVSVPIVAFADWRPPNGCIVLLCAKCYDNADILARLPEAVHLVPIQNGFDSALEARPPRVEGIASFVSECRPGRTHTRITRQGRLHLGINGPASARLLELASTLAGYLRHAPFRVLLVEDVRPFKYSKLMYNAALCPLAAAGGLDNAQVLLRPRVRELFFELLRENHSILTRAGVTLGKVGPLPTDMVARILARPWLARPLAWIFARTLRGSYCSMADDLPAGRTEVENYNGRLIQLAGHHTPCPLNRLVVALIGRMVARHLPPHPDRLNELWRAFRATAQPTGEMTDGSRLAG
jgi:2-dehydropantoate 2-reductase